MSDREVDHSVGNVSRRGLLTSTAAAIPATGHAWDRNSGHSAALGSIVMASSLGVSPQVDGDTNTRALNAGIRRLALRGGGRLIFDPAPGYTITGPVILPSNITIDLNNQLILGRRQPGDVLFVSGALTATGELEHNLDSADETVLITNAIVENGRIEDCRRIFHFRNFGRQCVIRDIVTRNCVQVGRFERCFFSTLSNVSAAGFSDPSIPTFHFIEQTNAVTLHRLSAVTAFGLCIEAGAAAVLVDGYTFEGGETGVAVIGDALGIAFQGGYFEAVEGRAFDLRKAGTCTISWEANYFHHVDIVIDDGGADTEATLFGRWSASNYVVRHTLSAFAKLKPARRLMQVAGPRNFVLYEAPYRNDATTGDFDNWVTSPSSRIVSESGSTGTSLTDIRARALLYSGIVPTVRTGDTGTPLRGTVPFATVAATSGKRARLEIRTGIAWQPFSLLARFVLVVEDDAGEHRLFGDIYGSDVVQHDSTGKTVRAVNAEGRLALHVTGLTAADGRPICTGTIQILT